ncbi:MULTISPECIES: hypothetical protein [Bacillaceae]|uniref:hypothetical protein n=1 Tax=Bacillaceae TaxID=186817 RepID=UPI000E75415F|nr:hypothetical protein [Bacillus sp. PK3_68]RJS59231.1 hypothetical protein CJ483_03420 [Bacillus sp. PK3_68]
MTLYIVTYDLNRPGQRYHNLLKVLRRYPDHHHILKSTFLINTTETTSQISEKIKTAGLADANDNYLITKITNPTQGWLPKSTWAWINERI